MAAAERAPAIVQIKRGSFNVHVKFRSIAVAFHYIIQKRFNKSMKILSIRDLESHKDF